MRKIVSLFIILLFLFTPALSEAKKLWGHKKKPAQVTTKTEQNAAPPEKISEPTEFEEVEPEGAEKKAEENSEEQNEEISAEEEANEHESVIEYSQEQEYKFMHEIIKVYS